MSEQTNSIINIRTNKQIKDTFFRLCKSENSTATSRINDYMRQVLRENDLLPNKKKSSIKNNDVNEWREELIRG